MYELKVPVTLLSTLLFCLADAASADPATLLNDFVVDYRSDPQATSHAFQFEVEVGDQGTWTVTGAGKGEVDLQEGRSGLEGLKFVIEPGTLRAIHAGKLGVLAAAGKAWETDYAPFDFTLGDEHGLPAELLSDIVPFISHFWTRGYPEITPFGLKASRVVHGAQAAALYYASGLRTAWYGIVAGQHINAKPEDQVNPFDTLVFMIGGQAKARLDGETMTLEGGASIHIPAGMTHEFWNDEEELAEFIIVMFGEGA